MVNEVGLLRKTSVTIATQNVYLNNRRRLIRSNEMVRARSGGSPEHFWAFLFSLVILILLCRASEGSRCSEREKIYTNGWAVKVSGGLAKAKIVARQHGFEKVEKVCKAWEIFVNYYIP